MTKTEQAIVDAAIKVTVANDTRRRVNERPWDGSKEMGRAIQQAGYDFYDALQAMYAAVNELTEEDNCEWIQD